MDWREGRIGTHVGLHAGIGPDVDFQVPLLEGFAAVADMAFVALLGVVIRFFVRGLDGSGTVRGWIGWGTLRSSR
jgi:hypothetical protein